MSIKERIRLYEENVKKKIYMKINYIKQINLN